jgi:hypothetical protein
VTRRWLVETVAAAAIGVILYTAGRLLDAR